MTRNQRFRTRWAGLLTASLIVTGCVTTTEVPSAASGAKGRVVTPDVPPLTDRVTAIGDAAERLRTRGVPTTYAVRTLAEVHPLGNIPYDNLTLPVISPDGRFIATQTGDAPEWATIYAAVDAPLPDSSRVEVYAIPEDLATPPALQYVVDTPTLLGRSANDEGFLIETPQSNGSRWIGIVAWTTGEVRWLVNDDELVAAFGCLGPGGRLAFSARLLEENAFGLFVSNPPEVWNVLPGDADWVMPTWAGGDGLFVLVRRGEMLDAVHGSAVDEATWRRTMSREPLANRNASVAIAHQTLAASAPPSDTLGPDTLAFFHPTKLRAAVWSPPEPPVILDRGSLSATVDREDPRFVLVTTARDLVRRDVSDENLRQDLIAGTHITRVTNRVDRPYLLFRPDDGVLAVTLMRLLPPPATAQTR